MFLILRAVDFEPTRAIHLHAFVKHRHQHAPVISHVVDERWILLTLGLSHDATYGLRDVRLRGREKHGVERGNVQPFVRLGERREDDFPLTRRLEVALFHPPHVQTRCFRKRLMQVFAVPASVREHEQTAVSLGRLLDPLDEERVSILQFHEHGDHVRETNLSLSSQRWSVFVDVVCEREREHLDVVLIFTFDLEETRSHEKFHDFAKSIFSVGCGGQSEQVSWVHFE